MVFDFVSGKVGIWTWITALTYGLLGVGAAIFFKKLKNSRFLYLKYAIIGTIIYDAITGLTIGPLMFHMSFRDAFMGQIPFTAMHLLGNSISALIISPLIYKWIVMNENLDLGIWWKKLAKN